jgi:ferredoxin
MGIMKEELDRRRFIKASAYGVALAGIAGTVSGIPPVFAQTTNKTSPSEWIAGAIREYTATSPRNSLKKTDDEKTWAAEKAWDEPLVGFASGADPIFNEYKDKVGEFHWTPLEIFKIAFPDTPAKPEELTVVVWILPAREFVRASLRKETVNPAEPWVRARMYGELFNEELRRYTAELLTKSGYPAVAPTLHKEFKAMRSEKYVFASTWSERHAAYAAGLGTFGLCDALITPKGKAMRCGAIVAKMPATPTPRPYTDHHAYCLHFAKGACGACIARCAGKAISDKGHDKMACNKQLGVTTQYAKEHYDIDGYGCGFCQTGTPCESRIPV